MIRFFDLDVPEVIELKLSLVQETDRYKLLGSSVLAYEWLDAILAHDNPVVILAEGLFMYLPKQDVKALLLEMGRRVRSGQLVVEMVNEKYTRGINQRLVAFKFKYELGFDEPLAYHCGIKDSDEIEAWSAKLHLIDDWCYFDAATNKLGWMRIFGRFEAFRKTQWIARYRIGE
jgi:O-methyltransferase involved in polyketide biosynthesis